MPQISKRSIKSKNRYQQMIAEYEARRREIREYTHWKGPGDTTEYLLLTVNLTRKIKAWRAMITRIEAREAKLALIEQMVCEFFNVKKLRLIRKHKHHTNEPTLEMAIRVFCKFAIEHRFCSRWVSYYLGCKGFRTASYVRTRFNKAFKTKPAYLETWRQFREYVNLQSNGKQTQVLYGYSSSDRKRVVRREEQGRRAA